MKNDNCIEDERFYWLPGQRYVEEFWFPRDGSEHCLERHKRDGKWYIAPRCRWVESDLLGPYDTAKEALAMLDLLPHFGISLDPWRKK